MTKEGYAPERMDDLDRGCGATRSSQVIGRPDYTDARVLDDGVVVVARVLAQPQDDRQMALGVAVHVGRRLRNRTRRSARAAAAEATC